MKIAIVLILLLIANIVRAQDFAPSATQFCELATDELRNIGVVAQSNSAYFIEPPDRQNAPAKKTMIFPTMIQFRSTTRQKNISPSKFVPIFSVTEYHGGSSAYFRSASHYSSAIKEHAEYAPEAIRFYDNPNNLIGIRFQLINNDASPANITLWYLPSKEFIDALPERFRSEVRKSIAGYVPDSYAINEPVERINFEIRSFAPNPAPNGQTTAKVSVRGNTRLSFELFDLAGRELLDLGNYTLSQGVHEIPLTFGEMQSGMYIIGIRSAEGQAEYGRLMIAR